MSAFTPGPWSAEFIEFGDTVTDRLCIIGPSPNFRDIATIDQCFQGDRNKAMEQANASLIAAAPELLAALRKFVDGEFTYYAGKVVGIDARLTQDDVNRAREAIEKAIKS